MPFWDGRAANAADIRLYVPGTGWRAAVSMEGDPDDALIPGSANAVGSVLLNILNATNLVVLTGTGSSFGVSNPQGRPTPAGMWDVWVAVRAAAGDAVFDTIVASFGAERVSENIEKLLTLCKLYLELHDGETSEPVLSMQAFVETAEQAILARVDFIDRESGLDAHDALIRKIGRRGVRKPRAKLFTTNYDLCFEEVARRSRFTLIDGFSHNLDQTYDRTHFDLDIVRREGHRENPDYVANVLQFYKLHGSIDWRRVEGDILRTRAQVGKPVLIYPRSSKYQESFDTPYLDMLSAFQAALREPDTALLISGFGFNDDHISSPIMSAIESNMSLRLAICDIAFIPDEQLVLGAHDLAGKAELPNRFLTRFRRLADSGDARVHLMNGRFQDLAAAMPDLIGETDRERHVQRMRAIQQGAAGPA